MVKSWRELNGMSRMSSWFQFYNQMEKPLLLLAEAQAAGR